MKKFLLLFAVFGAVITSFAQQDSSGKYVNSIQTVPTFRVNLLPDSTVFTNVNIEKQKPFVLMFFSPECEHCQRETKELLAYKNELKNIPILMVSMASFKEIRDFYDTYGLSAMPNVKLAQDVNFRLGIYYKLRTFPSLYVYDSRGKLAKAFLGNIGVPAILEAVK